MSINNKKQKSNKHANDETKELIDRPIRTFKLTSPEAPLLGFTSNSYKDAITNILRNFNGALFMREDDTLIANTDLTLDDIKEQLNRKLRINLHSLLLAIKGEKQPHYKNLDDFKSIIEVEIKRITLQQHHLADVSIERCERQPCYPNLLVTLDLKEFTLSDFAVCNIFDIPCYGSYLTSITTKPLSTLKFTRSLSKSILDLQLDNTNKFEIDVYDTNYYSLYRDKLVTTTFTFNLDLYFSHLQYLNQVINTYEKTSMELV